MLEHPVGRKTNGVREVLRLEELVDLGHGEGGVGTVWLGN